jgi:hypothetical protein
VRSDGILEDRSTDVKSNCFSNGGVKRSRVRHPALISTTGKPMRSRALLLISALPVALSITPSLAHGQRVADRDCRDRYTSYGSRYYDCSYDATIAARAREAAARARAEAREDANWARSSERRLASAVRADTRGWERSISRIRVQNDSRIRANESRIHLRERALDRERDRYNRRW